MSFFTKGDVPLGEPQMKDRETILAYLEELARMRVPVQLFVREEDRLPYHGQVQEVDEEGDRFLFRLPRALPGDLAVREKGTLAFPLDHSRFLAQVRFLTRGQYLEAWFGIPDAVRHAERRHKMRTRFSQREKATVTILEGDEEAQRGATGRLVDLSMEGLCMGIERAVQARTKRVLDVSSALFVPGTLLPVIRVEQLPLTPTLDLSGTVAHIRETPDGVLMGICFKPMGETEAQAIAQVMARRLPRFSQGYPVRKRLKAGQVPQAEEPQAPPPECEPQEAPEEEAQGQEALEDPQALRLRRQKRARRILVAHADDLDRAILTSALRKDGFGRIHEARTYLEALAHFKVFSLDLVILDHQVGAMGAQEFLTKLRKQGFCQETPVVLLSEGLDVRTRIMAKASGIAHVQQVPVDYDGQLKDVLAALLGLEAEPVTTS